MFTLSSTLQKEYANLLAAVQKSARFTPPFRDIHSVFKDHFEIYVKRIGAFSSFLHKFPVGAAESTGIKNEFQIRGLFVRLSSPLTLLRDLASG